MGCLSVAATDIQWLFRRVYDNGWLWWICKEWAGPSDNDDDNDDDDDCDGDVSMV